MSARYVPVQWNRNKWLYDLTIIAGIVVYILVFLKLAPEFQDVTRPIDKSTYRMQAFGSCAFLMLTAILCIGPLCRIDRRFLPLLYNRRHFGVLACAVAIVHASYVLGWYYAFSPVDPYVALLGINTSFGQVLGFPFEIFGVAALLILFILAATSHDFWLKFLGPPLWKAIHMAIYVAYGSVILHVALGHLQSSKTPIMAMVVAVSLAAVVTLHLIAARIEARNDEDAPASADETPWVVAGRLHDLAEDHGMVVAVENAERVAIFRYDGKLSAVSNVCAHQNGPLGEGRVIDGCVTCPWHGFQYRPADGCAPAPFTEKIATYRLALEGDTIMLDPRPLAAGTFVEPVRITER